MTIKEQTVTEDTRKKNAKINSSGKKVKKLIQIKKNIKKKKLEEL